MITRTIIELQRLIGDMIDGDAAAQFGEIVAEREQWYKEVRELRKLKKRTDDGKAQDHT